MWCGHTPLHHSITPHGDTLPYPSSSHHIYHHINHQFHIFGSFYKVLTPHSQDFNNRQLCHLHKPPLNILVSLFFTNLDSPFLLPAYNLKINFKVKTKWLKPLKYKIGTICQVIFVWPPIIRSLPVLVSASEEETCGEIRYRAARGNVFHDPFARHTVFSTGRWQPPLYVSLSPPRG